MWENGSFEIDGVKLLYEAKVFEEGSAFGINGGRISKLCIVKDIGELSWHGDNLAHYDRGWYICPRSELARKAVSYVMELYK